jgi:hypothetical protein
MKVTGLDVIIEKKQRNGGSIYKREKKRNSS